MLESTKTSSLESIKNLNLFAPPHSMTRTCTAQHQQQRLALIALRSWAKNIDDVTAISALTNVKVCLLPHHFHMPSRFPHCTQVISLSLNSITSLRPFASCTSLK